MQPTGWGSASGWLHLTFPGRTDITRCGTVDFLEMDYSSNQSYRDLLAKAYKIQANVFGVDLGAYSAFLHSTLRVNYGLYCLFA